MGRLLPQFVLFVQLTPLVASYRAMSAARSSSDAVCDVAVFGAKSATERMAIRTRNDRRIWTIFL